ncbi:MAG TPA: L-seryl-tRNA(Sec) selenium transferase [Jatrophihabitans sp.]|nr:L-seryl-tRNA(Sec) selenium transferase [Jatrophihabitans sp.]
MPRTDAVLADPRLAVATDRLGRAAVKRAVTAALGRVRDGSVPAADAADEAVRLLPAAATSLRRVLNATGVVLHTNLGRAPLSDPALEAMAAAAGYVDVEFDLSSGRRAARGRGTLAALRAAVPDAEDVLVVNNGAAALVLATTTLAAGAEVVVCRGELVEIGDGFRLPDLIASTGARLREVGTTNRTRLADYAAVVGPDTGCILKVHPSNFRIEGFTGAVPVHELATLSAPVVVDIGSGLLAPDPVLPAEPDVATTLRAGAAVVTCSGDKLLGGPQAGLAFGQASVIERMRRHPLYRAVRVDKLTLAALEATVAGPPPPATRYRGADPALLRRRCDALAAALAPDLPVEVVPSDGVIGGGGAPGLALPGWALALPAEFAPRLRAGTPPVVGRVERDRCLLDLRCIEPSDDEVLAAALRSVASR